MNKKETPNPFEKRRAIEAEKQDIANGKKQSPELLALAETRFGKEKLEEHRKQFAPRQLIIVGSGDKLALLRPPTVDDLSDYMTAVATNGMSKAVTLVLEALWIDGDFALIEDEDLFIAVYLQINNILEGKKADYFRF